MICPNCGYKDTKVCFTKKGFVNIRLRICMKCKEKFLTQELVKEDHFLQGYNDYLVRIGELEAKLQKKEEHAK